jgi:hypothetical protein
MSYTAPAAPGDGDKLPLDELKGALLYIDVEKETDIIVTVHGDATAIQCNVAVLDGDHKGETFNDVLIFPKVLKSQLRPAIKGDDAVLARLGQGEKKPGKNAPWILVPPTGDDGEIGRKYEEYAAKQAATDEIDLF